MICPKCNQQYETIQKEIAGSVYTFPVDCPECAKKLRERLESETKQEAQKQWRSNGDI